MCVRKRPLSVMSAFPLKADISQCLIGAILSRSYSSVLGQNPDIRVYLKLLSSKLGNRIDRPVRLKGLPECH